MRERFEHWMSDGDADSPAIRRSERNPEGYSLMTAQTMWTAWEAAWKECEKQLNKPTNKL